MLEQTLTTSLQLSVRAAAAAGLAIVIAPRVGLQYPIYAVISAVVVTDLDAAKTRKLGVPRLTGTILGGAVGALGCALLPSAIWVGIAGIVVAMFLCGLMHQPDAAKIAGYVAAIVLVQHGDSPWIYGFHRTMETFLGIVLAILISLVPKLLPAKNPRPQAS